MYTNRGKESPRRLYWIRVGRVELGQDWERHRVTPEESEEVFFHDPFMLKGDTGQSSREKRYGVPGQTAKGRRLFVVFTVRGNLIRVISARDLNQKEDREYRRYEKSDS